MKHVKDQMREKIRYPVWPQAYYLLRDQVPSHVMDGMSLQILGTMPPVTESRVDAQVTIMVSNLHSQVCYQVESQVIQEAK